MTLMRLTRLLGVAVIAASATLASPLPSAPSASASTEPETITTVDGEATSNGFVPLAYHPVLNTTTSTTKLSSSTPLTVQVTGVSNVPVSGVTAVSLDVTTTNSQASSWVAVAPSTGGAGITNHFTTPGHQAQNNVYVAPGADGKIKLSTGGAATDVVVAITGYFTNDGDGAGFVPATAAARLLDTRTGAALAPNATVAVKLPAPPADTNAAALSITTTGSDRRGWLSVVDPTSKKAVSLDYDTMAGSSSLITSTSSSGEFTVTNKGLAATHVLVDLQGYFVAGAEGGGFVADPHKVMDTRADEMPIPAGGVLNVAVAGTGEVPLEGVVAYALDVTVLSGAQPGYVQVYPANQSPSGTAVVNFQQNDRRTNSGLISSGLPFAPSDVAIHNRSSSDIHVLVDVMGYFEAAVPDYVPYETGEMAVESPMSALANQCPPPPEDAADGEQWTCAYASNRTDVPTPPATTTASPEPTPTSSPDQSSMVASAAAPVPPSWCQRGKTVYDRHSSCSTSMFTLSLYQRQNGRSVLVGQGFYDMIRVAHPAARSGTFNVENWVKTVAGSYGAALTGNMTFSHGILGSGCRTANQTNGGFSGPIPAIGKLSGRGLHQVTTSATARGAAAYCTPTIILTVTPNGGWGPSTVTDDIANLIRCDTTNPKVATPVTGCVNPRFAASMAFSNSKMPTIVAHVQLAQKSGLPKVLARTTNAYAADQNRKLACSKALPGKRGYSCDEYPMASSRQGLYFTGGRQRTFDGCGYPSLPKATGAVGASVCLVPEGEQDVQGGVMSSFYQNERYLDGDPYQVVLIR